MTKRVIPTCCLWVLGFRIKGLGLCINLWCLQVHASHYAMHLHYIHTTKIASNAAGA